MRQIVLAILILLAASTTYAIDEGTYIQFTADSIIVAYELKGRPNAMELWMQEMGSRHPQVKSDDWQTFEAELKGDPVRKEAVYNQILQVIQSKGYNARIVDLGEGKTTIEILE